MRKFIRHPSSIPLEFSLEKEKKSYFDYTRNMSRGGIAFRSKIFLPEGAIIKIKLPLLKPIFQARAKVIWCRQMGSNFEVGASFLDADEAEKARMVEEICYIEQYRRDVEKKEGRLLSSEEAAREWINKFAHKFPYI